MVDVRPPHEALYHYRCEFDAFGLMHRFARRDVAAHPDHVTNFLGVRIPTVVHPPVLDRLKGRVEPVPDPGNWHADIAEWGAALRSVEQTRGDTYRIVELGCGWGCWLVNMGSAARDRGLKVDLIGVEGDAHHLENARAVLELNGFGAQQFTLHHGIAAPRPGKAIFPRHDRGASDWGGQAIFDPDAPTLARAARDPAVQVLDCFTLARLSGDRAIDLLHIDIQGAELDFVRGNMASLTRLVRRVLIGTHSRFIEGSLMEHFLAAGWRLEMDRPVIYRVSGGRPVLDIDGVQMWANPALT